MPRISSELAASYRQKLLCALNDRSLPLPETVVNPTPKGLSPTRPCTIQVVPEATITAALRCRGTKTALLNFASFQEPGGKFMVGAFAQEEFLCYCTNLYSELCMYKETWYESHKNCLHKGMYENQSLLSKDISIVMSAPGEILPKQQRMQVDVLTCAAPNWSGGIRYNSVPSAVMNHTTKERINYVLQIMSDGCYDNVILGAFGCGVFRNDPLFVARVFKEYISKYSFNNIIFAIPDENSYNYRIFANSLGAKFSK